MGSVQNEIVGSLVQKGRISRQQSIKPRVRHRVLGPHRSHADNARLECEVYGVGGRLALGAVKTLRKANVVVHFALGKHHP